jgi:hypothetical protein
MSDEKTIKQPEVIKYFIFNKNIKKSANIKDFLENNSKKKFVKEVEKLFQQRDLYNRMQKKLSTKTTLVKKRKI